MYSQFHNQYYISETPPTWKIVFFSKHMEELHGKLIVTNQEP